MTWLQQTHILFQNYNGITYNEFLKSNTRTAAIAFERVYERCGDYSFEDSRRADNAEKAYNDKKKEKFSNVS